MAINKSSFSNEKCQGFLSLLRDKIILQEPDNKAIKIVSIKYKNLLTIFDDYDEAREYLLYLEKQGFIRLKHISKQRIRDKKIPDDIYISKITPDNDLLTGDDFYRAMRYHKINYYPEDLFIFEYDEQKIQQSLNKKGKGLSNTDKEKNSKKDGLKNELIEEANRKLEEQRKVFEEFGKKFSSLIPPDSVRALKQYEELTKKLTKQLTPLKSALEEIGRLQSVYSKNSLTPTLQRLTAPVKQIEEQMKRLKPLFEHSECPKEAFISSDVIQVRQETETISKLENIEVLLQRLLSKDKEKLMQEEKIKFFPQVYGIGINLKYFIEKGWNKLKNIILKK